MRVVADRDRCVTAGLCVLTAPAVFTQDDEAGTVILLMERPPPGLRAAVREAVNLCPSGAISLDLEDDSEDGEAT